MKWFFKQHKILLLSLLAVFAVVGTTVALLVATDTQVTNSFQFAKIDTSITEETGHPNEKLVKIQNDDISSVYVRARVVVSGADVGVAKVEYVTAQPDTLEPDTIYVVYNAQGWDKSGEWFYYKGILPGKQEGQNAPETPALMTQVFAGADVDSTHTFEVDVYQESVLTSKTDYVLAEAQAAFKGN